MVDIFPFSDVACVAFCLFLLTGSCHVCIQIHTTCCCIPDAPQRCTTWLDFGTTPDPENLQPDCGFVWVKSSCSEAIAWRKVWLTKQQNVDLTTNGLWAMPLNTGWAPVKESRLQDWENLKKYVPIHKHGDVCPMVLLWLHHPCLLGVSVVGRNQYDYNTPAFSGSPWWGEINMATSPRPSWGPHGGEKSIWRNHPYLLGMPDAHGGGEST